MPNKRREIIKLATAASITALLPRLSSAADAPATATTTALSKLSLSSRVVIIGGGYAGADAAKYIRMWSDGLIEVVVIEQNQQFVSCPVSNLVLGGSKSINDLTFGYDLLKSRHAIRWITDTVTAIDTQSRKITLSNGEINYDRLIIAPGIDFVYDQLPGLQTKQAQAAIPHAWKAGLQTVALRNQLMAIPDGGVFVMSIPKAPYRCPPGPYERACQVAFYLKSNKPKSKIIVLDANPEIVSKKGLFTKAWAEIYPGMIDYRPNSSVVEVDVNSRTVKTEFETVHADVLNIIPPQRAGKIAQLAGAANKDKRWCEVDFLTYESKVIPHVHILGDAVAAALPKSAHIATSQAKVCAAAVIALLAEQSPDPAPVFANTCYSYVTDSMAMHVANVYRYDAEKQLMIAAEGGGVSEKASELEGRYAEAWAKNIWTDVLT